jgi:glucose/arabinose dehydrogenase
MITYGIDYSGAMVSDKTAMDGMEQPIYQWTPSIAPSGMDFYAGDRFPQWRGELFVGALAAKNVHHLHIVAGKIVSDEALLGDLKKRIREVRSGPDGFIYLMTDEADGKLLRLEPARSHPVAGS